MLNYLDLFSGIGGFPYGFEQAGLKIGKHYFSEIDSHAIANYQHNFKTAIYAGNIQSIRPTDLGRIDIITFGSPCQDFSIAGQRAGLDGERSNLILEAIRLISQLKPRFFIWENVKGTFSSNNGADFWAIIQAFANIGGYRIEWQLLNTLWMLPQNRERIYLIGHLATPRGSFRPVFPITKNDQLFIEKNSRQKRELQTEHCSTLTAKLRSESTYIAPQYAGTITGGGHSGGLHSDMTLIKAVHYGNSQQDRLHEPTGAMCALPKERLDDKTKILAQRKRHGKQEIEIQKNNHTNTITSAEKDNYVWNGYDAIRRLTEIECERLQGFPDDWTQYGLYNNILKKIAKTNRYKLTGNAVTTTMPQIIMKHLIKNYNL